MIDRAQPGDVRRIGSLLGMAFGFSPERSAEYLSHVGHEAFFVARTESGITACAALLDTRQRFGGRWVPAANIAHVAIAPEARGRGLARPLIGSLCAAATMRGAAMVTLFASARPVYRRCGFELAGTEMVYEAETAALPARADLEFRQIEPDDDAIRTAYDCKTACEAGLLARSEPHWREVLRAPSHALEAYVGGEGLGACYVIVDASDPGCLVIRDWHASDGATATGLLAFLGRFRSVFPRVRWHGGPHDDLVAAMPDKGWHLAHQEEWLARITDPRRALESRGYLPQHAALGLTLTGPDGERTDLVLELVAGEPRVRSGPADLPTLAMPAHMFASLFTGFRSASRLKRLGVITGSEEAARVADLVFSGPAPWLAEHV